MNLKILAQKDTKYKKGVVKLNVVKRGRERERERDRGILREFGVLRNGNIHKYKKHGILRCFIKEQRY